MNNLFLAKTKNMETIIEHTDNLYKNFLILKKLYPNLKNIDWNILKIACLYHDLGKMNTKFQNKLIRKLKKDNPDLEELKDDLKDIDEIPHGYLSPAFLPKQELKKIYNSDKLRILYQSIYYHHNRKKLDNNEELKQVVKQDLSKYVDDFNYDKIDKINKLYPSFERYVRVRISEDEDDSIEIIKEYIMTKGLLNKIDYAASSGVDVEVENKDLFEKTMKSLKDNEFEPNELQKYMINHQDDNNIIRASTGIGKTEAALFWIGNNKGFFTLPLKTSINSIYDRVVEKIKFERKNTGLLHSETASQYIKTSKNDEEFDMKYYDMTKQLSLPLTVCTLDQLVDFVFKYEGYELKLATLSYSKLVIDEIQMYSPEMVAFLIAALKYIVEMGGKFSIVTATLPPIFLYFIDKYVKNYKKPKPFYKMKDGKIQLRHRMKLLNEDINIDIIKNNYKDKKVLVIVNTVKKAQQLYHELKDELKEELENGVTQINLLHSRFIKQDRAIKEKRILDMGKSKDEKNKENEKNEEKGIWISTQIVEASLDIDFDVLYTELSDISGLFQRMGRVYRNRDLNEEYTNVYVYLGDKKLPSGIGSGSKSIIDKDIFDLSKKYLIEYVGEDVDGKYINEKDKMELVEKVYSLENLKGKNYYNKIDTIIKDVIDIRCYDIDKRDINLRNISTQDVIPRCIYEEHKDEIYNNIQIINESKDNKELPENKRMAKRISARDKITQFTLSIPQYQYDKAYKNGYVQEFVEINDYYKIPIIDYEYNFDVGIIFPQDKEINIDSQFV